MWASIKLLAKERMMAFQELFDEAMRDLLKKHGIPASLKEALSKSAARHEAKERKKPQKRQRRTASGAPKERRRRLASALRSCSEISFEQSSAKIFCMATRNTESKFAFLF